MCSSKAFDPCLPPCPQDKADQDLSLPGSLSIKALVELCIPSEVRGTSTYTYVRTSRSICETLSNSCRVRRPASALRIISCHVLDKNTQFLGAALAILQKVCVRALTQQPVCSAACVHMSQEKRVRTIVTSRMRCGVGQSATAFRMEFTRNGERPCLETACPCERCGGAG